MATHVTERALCGRPHSSRLCSTARNLHSSRPSTSSESGATSRCGASPHSSWIWSNSTQAVTHPWTWKSKSWKGESAAGVFRAFSWHCTRVMCLKQLLGPEGPRRLQGTAGSFYRAQWTVGWAPRQVGTGAGPDSSAGGLWCGPWRSTAAMLSWCLDPLQPAAGPRIACPVVRGSLALSGTAWSTPVFGLFRRRQCQSPLGA